MDRRSFCKLASASLPFLPHVLEAATDSNNGTPSFATANARWQAAYNKALNILEGNVRVMPRYAKPVLIEGADYPGVWQECAPQEGLVYRPFRADVARANHTTFFVLQRGDGQLPANNKLSETGFGQIQMVVPIAATAWELAQLTDDQELLEQAYASCSRWDNWLMQWRNTRGTGLVEGFCTYDTGHDNSPRWAGIPAQCPNKDAKRFPPIPTLPRLCPDLSATTYGGRIALAAMAKALGKETEASLWLEKAESLRKLIMERLYVAEDAAFYDLDAENNFVKVRCDVLSRVCGEHVVDQKTFDHLWEQQIHNPKAFWAPFPLPSIALDDPHFVRPIPRNTWGGPSQALTALRAGRWFDFYGHAADFSQMMDQWCEAIQRDMTFRQQMDPLNAVFTVLDAPGYSPVSLVMYDYTWRLAGVREELETLEWNVRPGHPAAEQARFEVAVKGRKTATMRYDTDGAQITLGGRELGRIHKGTVRLVTDKIGKPISLHGIALETQTVQVAIHGKKEQTYKVEPNQVLNL